MLRLGQVLFCINLSLQRELGLSFLRLGSGLIVWVLWWAFNSKRSKSRPDSTIGMSVGPIWIGASSPIFPCVDFLFYGLRIFFSAGLGISSSLLPQSILMEFAGLGEISLLFSIIFPFSADALRILGSISSPHGNLNFRSRPTSHLPP